MVYLPNLNALFSAPTLYSKRHEGWFSSKTVGMVRVAPSRAVEQMQQCQVMRSSQAGRRLCVVHKDRLALNHQSMREMSRQSCEHFFF